MTNISKFNEFTHIFVTNIQEDFTENLSPIIKLEGDWLVAVSSISYPTYYKKKESYIKLRFTKDSTDVKKVYFQLDEDPKITIENIRQALFFSYLPLQTTHYIPTFQEKNGYVHFSLSRISRTTDNVEDTLFRPIFEDDNPMIEQLGFHIPTLNTWMQKLPTTESLASQLPLQNKKVKSFLLYSSITKGPLAILPRDKNFLQYENLHYEKLMNNSLTKIKFVIRTAFNEVLTFDHGDLLVSLVFKRVYKEPEKSINKSQDYIPSSSYNRDDR